MFDFQIQSVETLMVSTSPSNRRFTPPRLLMKNKEFIQGYTKGFTAAIHSTDALADEPLSDEEIIDIVRGVFLEEGTPTEEEASYALGNLVGVILAKC